MPNNDAEEDTWASPDFKFDGIAQNIIYRILSPGGKTYIGGGLGNGQLAASIRVKMKEIKPEWPEDINRRLKSIPVERLKGIFDKHLISYEILENEEQDRWIILHQGIHDQ